MARRVLLPWLIVLLASTLASAQVKSRGGTNPVDFTIDFSGALGGLASVAGATLLQKCSIAGAAGHFTNLVIVTDLNGATCTTAPTFSIRDNTTGINGTAKLASTSAGLVNQTESLTFSNGDTICITRTVNGATCTVPFFAVTAEFAEP